MDGEKTEGQKLNDRLSYKPQNASSLRMHGKNMMKTIKKKHLNFPRDINDFLMRVKQRGNLLRKPRNYSNRKVLLL